MSAVSDPFLRFKPHIKCIVPLVGCERIPFTRFILTYELFEVPNRPPTPVMRQFDHRLGSDARYSRQVADVFDTVRTFKTEPAEERE